MTSKLIVKQPAIASLSLSMAASLALFALALAGCKDKVQADGALRRPGYSGSDMNLITIDSKDVAKFPLVTAEKIEAAAELSATGAVFPDVSAKFPSSPLPTPRGRHQGPSRRQREEGPVTPEGAEPDITNAFDTYLKAVNDEQLANKAFVRAQDLFQHGAISQSMLEQAEDSEKDAKATSPPPKSS